jgi:hypothetical protein
MQATARDQARSDGLNCQGCLFFKGHSTRLKNPSGKGNLLIVVHNGIEKGFVYSCVWVFESHSTREYNEEMTVGALHR